MDNVIISLECMDVESRMVVKGLGVEAMGTHFQLYRKNKFQSSNEQHGDYSKYCIVS